MTKVGKSIVPQSFDIIVQLDPLGISVDVMKTRFSYAQLSDHPVLVSAERINSFAVN